MHSLNYLSGTCTIIYYTVLNVSTCLCSVFYHQNRIIQSVLSTAASPASRKVPGAHQALVNARSQLIHITAQEVLIPEGMEAEGE